MKITTMYSGAKAGILGINFHSSIPNTTMTFWANPRSIYFSPSTPPPSALTRSTVTAPMPSPPLHMPNPFNLQPEWCFFNSNLWFYTSTRMKSKAFSLSWWGLTISNGTLYSRYGSVFWSFNAPCSLSLSRLWAFTFCLKCHVSSIFCSPTFQAGFIEGATPAGGLPLCPTLSSRSGWGTSTCYHKIQCLVYCTQCIVFYLPFYMSVSTLKTATESQTSLNPQYQEESWHRKGIQICVDWWVETCGSTYILE